MTENNEIEDLAGPAVPYWSCQGVIGRRAYLAWGAGLFALKFILDWFVATYFFQRAWLPAMYLFPGRWLSLDDADDIRFSASMLALALPFIYVGVCLTLRRLRAAQLPLALVILFFVPAIDWLFFALLCILPSQTASSMPPPFPRPSRIQWLLPRSAWGSALCGCFLTAALGVAILTLAVEVFENYGIVLFVLTPFVLGLVSVLIYGCSEPRDLGECSGVAMLSTIFAGTAFLLVGLEGFLCLLMAAPLALPLAALGGLVGYLIQRHEGQPPHLRSVSGSIALALPLLLASEHFSQPPARLFAVESAVIIDAPPEIVWRHVIAFSELPPPTEWLFRAGIAYPIRAEIDGHGVGAMRRCVFSTGPFLEPIQVWDEPRLLQFGVTANPPPMRELSIYSNLHPPHLDGFLVSEKGEFRLTRLPGGRTKLAGTTWYRHHLSPETYWQWWSDAIIHRIHMRVLRHIEREAETTSNR